MRYTGFDNVTQTRTHRNMHVSCSGMGHEVMFIDPHLRDSTCAVCVRETVREGVHLVSIRVARRHER